LSIIKESENGIKCSTERMGNWVEMGWCRQQGSGNVDTKKKKHSHTHMKEMGPKYVQHARRKKMAA